MRKFLFLSVMLTLMAVQSWAQRTIAGKFAADKGSLDFQPLPSLIHNKFFK